MDPEDLIYDWNLAGGAIRPAWDSVLLADETLRDGLQSPSVVSPTIEQKIELLHLMAALKIDIADIGMPGAGSHVEKQVERLAREIVDEKLSIKAYCAARTVEADILPVLRVSQKVGLSIEVAAFIGSSPIRQYTEGWDMANMVKLTRDAVALAVGNGLPVDYVTEDTTRARPADLQALYGAAIQAGASRICVCDTVGHATPEGVESLIHFVLGIVEKENPDVRIDWHGHQDRGLSIPNTIRALQAGAQRVHACGLGVGERVGNTPMDQLLVNLQLLGWIDRDLSQLAGYVRRVFGIHEGPDPGLVSGDRPRRLSDRDGNSRGGDHQGARKGARLAGRSRLFRCTGRYLRAPTDHRGRSDVGGIQRPVLAQGAWGRGDCQSREGRLPLGEGIRPHPLRKGDPGRRGRS
jgi:hypothetical protein